MSLIEHAPRLSMADAERLAREFYGIQAEARPLASERDQNFQLDAGDRRFVLKLANPTEARALLDAQNAAMAHLARAVPFCPAVVPAIDGSAIVREPGGHFVRMLTWLPGVPLARIRWHSPAVLEELGSSLGRLDSTLASFDHPALHREFYWDLAHAFPRVRAALPRLTEDAWRTTLARAVDGIEERLVPRLNGLRRSIIHNDANDYNVLVSRTIERGRVADRITGIIDFGDMVHSYTVGDLAVALAYAVLDKADPLGAAVHVVRGYHSARSLHEDEVAVLFDLLELRLCLSVAVALDQHSRRPDDDYLTISQSAIRRTLPVLFGVHRRLAEAAFRLACGLTPSAKSARVASWLRSQPAAATVVGTDDAPAKFAGIDLSVSSALVSGDESDNRPEPLGRRIEAVIAAARATVGVGGYLEARTLYSSPLFTGEGGERRSIHLGLDFFAPPGTAVRAALGGVVHACADNRQPLDYGPLVILEHQTDEGDTFYTLHGHLGREVLSRLRPGVHVERGDLVGSIGSADVNGGWAPHLHFQVITDLLDRGGDFPGVCRPAEKDIWAALSPDPNLLTRLDPDLLPAPPVSLEASATARAARVGRNVRTSYHRPLKIARGWMQYLYDSAGRRFVDTYNNVPHVGHSHPHVVRAAAEQLRVLNTNTRYLHDTLDRFARELTATLPPALSVCYFVNSGSEANELALRLARAHTRRRDVIVLEGAYHGITTSLIDLSPYKFDGPGGQGKPDWVHVAALPDTYRGRHRDAGAAQKYAEEVGAIVAGLRESGRGAAAFLAESAPSVGGQIILPPGYLERVYSYVRASGGVCIADEVQTAYGRMGTSFYAFEAQSVVPDVVVLGKPIGNGYPVGAVVTTPDIAASFDNGMEFFSTFGGSTVACAAGLAVLEVVRNGRLQEHARRVGDHLLHSLGRLQTRHAWIGDVRGSGLFIGVELVVDRVVRLPAPAEADYVVNRLKDEGILIGTDGPQHNVLKIRPPMPFDEADAEVLTSALDRALGELG